MIMKWDHLQKDTFKIKRKYENRIIRSKAIRNGLNNREANCITPYVESRLKSRHMLKLGKLNLL